MRTPGKQKLRNAVYGLYERRLRRSLAPDRIPRHIGVIIDGNRRWARSAGNPVSQGHEAGANKIVEFLDWCDDVGVKVVTVWMLSTDNLTRPADELEPLLRIIEQTVEELTSIGRWRIHPVGALDLLPGATAEVLKGAEAATQGVEGMLVNVAVGYGGRRELADAVRSLLLEEAAKGSSIEEVAEHVDVEHIAEHLYTKGQPDPDLVIRTSGEQRLGGFLLWQSALSEFYFCEALWPDFRHVDFLRAVRSYAQRERRFGT
ncbi:isoprenyl transferase [Kribbella sp. NPDC026596]|uniref:isoprenyl transferase n=1 Tax=Kribbella sp. NPDC026596 TaxID=3155122 RepID=UPI0033F167D6